MREKLKILLVDDEQYARQELKFLLQNYDFAEVSGEAMNGEDAVVKALQIQPDVIFLDMEMPKINGLDVALSLQELKKKPLIIFATAYPQFAAKAFRLEAVDYLLKPYDAQELAETMQRIQKRIDLQQAPPVFAAEASFKKLAVEMDGETHYVLIEDIYYLYHETKVTKIAAKTGELVTKTTLREMEGKLKNHAFFRIHKSYLANLAYVKKLTPWFNGAYQLELTNVRQLLPVSRNYVRALKQILA